MDKKNFICSGTGLELFCDLALYVDDEIIEIDLVLLKRIVLKKWVICKRKLLLVWTGTKDFSLHYQRISSYMGFMFYDGDYLELPMTQIIRGGTAYERRFNNETILLKRNIIEQVLSANAIGIGALDDVGIDVKRPSKKSFEISDAKKYKKWLSQIYNDTKQPGDTPEDVCVRMKANNIQGKLLDKLQNDGFLYSRKYTWDKVYKRENE